MEIGFHANMVDASTERVSALMSPIFDRLKLELKGDYETLMEHLWIDLELIPARSNGNGTSKWPFRFQKRVSGRSQFGLPPQPDQLNVGHYSIRPDFQVLYELTGNALLNYVLNLIYQSFETLENRKPKIGNFNVELLRSRFANVCKEFGVVVGA